MNTTRGRYERIATGIERAHKPGCRYFDGGSCSLTCPYRAEVFDRVTKRRKKATHPNLTAAKRWREDKAVALRAGSERVTERSTLTEAFEEWERQCRKGIVKASTGGDYKPDVLRNYVSKMNNYVLPKLGRAQVSEIRLRHVQELVDDLVAKGQAPKSVKNAIVSLRAVVRWCIRRELMTADPCVNLALPSGEAARERVATPAEALDLIAALPLAHDRALFATAFFTGLRRGELMALRWEDVDLAAGTLHTCRSYTPSAQRDRFERNDSVLEWMPGGTGAFVKPKTKKADRVVPIPGLLLPFLAGLDRTEGLVFGNDGVQPFNAPHVGERVKQAWTDAKKDPITLHGCRHTYVSLLVAAGVRIDIISEKVGHSSVTITLDRYRHLLPGTDDEVRDQFDSYLASATKETS